MGTNNMNTNIFKQSNPLCPDCGTELEAETESIDQFDPVRGHWQIESDIYYCPKCDEAFDPCMFKDEDAEFDAQFQDS